MLRSADIAQFFGDRESNQFELVQSPLVNAQIGCANRTHGIGSKPASIPLRTLDPLNQVGFSGRKFAQQTFNLFARDFSSRSLAPVKLLHNLKGLLRRAAGYE